MNTKENQSYMNLAEMTTVIKSFLENNGFTYKTINSCNDIQILYKLINEQDKSRISKLSFGVKYIAGLFFETIEDVQSMMEIYLDGAKQGCSECLNLLGRYYYKKQDYIQMMEFWRLAIEKNNIDAMFNISKYFEDEGQYQNMVQSLQMAISLGSEKAIQSLAKYYAKNRQIEKMIETYRDGLHNGYTSCMVELGKYYMSQRNIENAIKYFSSAAKTNPEAMYRLGMYYESTKDYGKMIDLYNKAILQNHTESMVRLGDYYKKIKNYDLMVNTYKMAAQTNSDAMNKLGLYYQKKKQYPEMLKYYESAVKLGCVNAMNNIAIYYESIGQYDNMRFFLDKAIEKKSSVAMYNMGLYYEKIKNYDKMAEYFMMSYQNGRFFDYSEIRLMKKSIVRLQKPNFTGFVKLLDDKKNQLKAFFQKKQQEKTQKENIKSLKKKIKIKRTESNFKLSKDIQEKKEESTLIDIPVEKSNTKPLFENMDLYKIFSSIDSSVGHHNSNIKTVEQPEPFSKQEFPLHSSQKYNSLNPTISHLIQPSKYDMEQYPPQHTQFSSTFTIPDKQNIASTQPIVTHSYQPNVSHNTQTFGNQNQLNSEDLNMYKLFLGLRK
jgi:TPR repeat protein